MQNNKWNVYKRKGTENTAIEACYYTVGDDLTNVTIEESYNPKEGDMIFMNPYRHENKWLMDSIRFDRNYELSDKKSS